MGKSKTDASESFQRNHRFFLAVFARGALCSTMVSTPTVLYTRSKRGLISASNLFHVFDSHNYLAHSPRQTGLIQMLLVSRHPSRRSKGSFQRITIALDLWGFYSSSSVETTPSPEQTGKGNSFTLKNVTFSRDFQVPSSLKFSE